MSDLHLESEGSRGCPPLVRGVDAVLVGGDTCPDLATAVRTLRQAYPDVEIVTVAGNHEFWSRRWSYDEQLVMGREAADRLDVRLLERNVAFVGNLRILGCTLWTDYDAFGESLRPAAMRAAAGMMLDHSRIKWRRDPWRRFRPEEARMLHIESREFLQRELEKAHTGPTICLVHHAMTLEAAAPVFRDDLTTAAFVSRLEWLIDRHQPDLVVSGHTHHSMDIRRGHARLVSNPAGYGRENESFFDPSFVVELADV